MEKKYTVLRVIATLYKIAGVLIALGTILFVILEIVGTVASDQFLRGYGFTGGPVWAFLGVIVTFLAGGLSALGVYAIGEALYLLIGLEENTRFSAILLRDRFYPQPPSTPLPPQQPMAPQRQPMMAPQQPMMPSQQPMMPPQQPTEQPPASNPPYTPA